MYARRICEVAPHNIFALQRRPCMHEDRQGEQWSIEDTGSAKARIGEKASASRFDPYQGAAMKKPSRKRDLRKIGEWLEAKRRAEAPKRENEGNRED